MGEGRTWVLIKNYSPVFNFHFSTHVQYFAMLKPQTIPDLRLSCLIKSEYSRKIHWLWILYQRLHIVKVCSSQLYEKNCCVKQGALFTAWSKLDSSKTLLLISHCYWDEAPLSGEQSMDSTWIYKKQIIDLTWQIIFTPHFPVSMKMQHFFLSEVKKTLACLFSDYHVI